MVFESNDLSNRQMSFIIYFQAVTPYFFFQEIGHPQFFCSFFFLCWCMEQLNLKMKLKATRYILYVVICVKMIDFWQITTISIFSGLRTCAYCYLLLNVECPPWVITIGISHSK